MSSYKQIFYSRFANPRGNVKKGVKIDDVWNSIEEFLRLILDPPKQPKTKFKQVSNPLDDEGQIKNDKNKSNTKKS